MKLIETQILKSRAGVYQDTSKNRRLHRVGQRYGEGKKEEAEDDKKSVDSIMEKFSDMFFDRNVSKNTLENFIEKYLGKGSFNEAWEKVDKRKFDSSTEKDNAFVREIQNMLVEKQGSKKEVEPSKELEAVNKVIAAINEGKMNLPASEALKLSEKKKKLEAKVKDEVSKENKAKKSTSKKYDKMNIEEAKKELLGKKLSIKDIETGETRTEKITSIVEGNVRGHSTIMARVEGGGTYPIKHIGTGKEWKAWKLDIVSESGKEETESKETQPFSQKKFEENIEDTKKELDGLKGSEKKKSDNKEEKETYTRVKFDDLPNSGKVNLKKYLSDKVKRTADQNLGVLSKVSTDNLKKMEAGLVSEFNSQFDDLPKSRRAEKLYSIMKVKNELAKRGTEAK